MGRPFSLIFPGLDCDESHHISRLLTATNADGLVIDASRIRGSQHIAELLESIDTVVFPTLWFTLLVCQAAVGNGRRVMLTGQFGDHWFDMRAPRGWRARGDQFLRDALLLVPGPRLGNLLYRGLRRLVASLSASQQVRHQSMPLNGDLLSKPRASVHSVDRSIVEQKVRARLRFFQTSWVGQSWEQVAEAQQVELRHPLADPDLIELACATPSSLLDSPLIKPGLRQALVGLLPEEIRLRSDKTTFDSLVFEDRELMDLAQSPDQWSLVKQGIIDGHRLEAYYRQSLEAGAAVAPMAWLCSAELFVRHLVTDTRGSTSL
ncbi:MAG: asparagine synthase [bacterium]|nr:asparagine synthase [bacterium]